MTPSPDPVHMVGPMHQLDFLIIGAQKSASTYLHRCLASHPQIYMPSQEIPAFEDPHYSTSALQALDQVCARAPRNMLVGIKRPDYLGKKNCAERIARHVPRALLLATLRNPVERAASAYYHYMAEGHLPVRPIEFGMRLLLDGAYQAHHPRSEEVLAFGLYFRHINAYIKHFSRERLLLMLQEDLSREADATLTRVYDFLGVDHAELPPREKAKEGVYSLPRLRYRQATRSWARPTDMDWASSGGAKYSLPARAILGFDTRLLSRVFLDERPMLSAELVGRLRQFYADDIARLEHFLGRDLSHWMAG